MKYAMILLILTTASLQARPGCLDNSFHLQEKYDAGQWHPVRCNCPCGTPGYRILANGMCINCRHRHDAAYEEIITYHGQQPTQPTYPSLASAVKYLLAKLK